jgi:adenine phosphoribosyltransferase
VAAGGVSVTAGPGGCQRQNAKNSAVMTMALGTATANRAPGSAKTGPTFVLMRSTHDSRGSRGSRYGEANGPLVQLDALIRAIPDFPIPGILFRDITPLLSDAAGFKAMVDLFADKFRGANVEYVVGIEARGYMLGAPVAYALGAGFVPVRKPGKLPGDKFSEEYELEYGTNTLEIHADAVTRGKRVLVIDDLLATGGTMAATLRLLERLGAHIAGVGVLIELSALNGRAALPGVDVTSFITY